MESSNASYLQVESWLGMASASNVFEQDHHHHHNHLEDAIRCQYKDANVFTNSNCTYSAHEITQDVAHEDLYGFIRVSIWHIVSKLPYLFYMVWPTETMFPVLDQVPRYVTEVSVIELANKLANWISGPA